MFALFGPRSSAEAAHSTGIAQAADGSHRDSLRLLAAIPLCMAAHSIDKARCYVVCHR